MNRRSFFKGILGCLATVAVGPSLAKSTPVEPAKTQSPKDDRVRIGVDPGDPRGSFTVVREIPYTTSRLARFKGNIIAHTAPAELMKRGVGESNEH